MSPANQVSRHAGCPRDGLGHDASQGALPEVSGQQPDQERALAVSRAAQQRAEQPAPLGLRALAGNCPDGLKRRISAGQRQGWLSGRIGRPEQVPQCRVADPDLSLAQFAGQEGHRDRHLAGWHRGEQHGDLVDLGTPRLHASDRR